MSELIKSLVEKGITVGSRVLGVVVILFVAWVIAGAVRKVIRKNLEERGIDATLSRFFANVARYAIIIMAAIGCLGIFGFETTSFAAIFGAAGIAIGLAFQGTLSNLAAGVMLIIFRPFKAGDLVEAGGQLGTVEEIELFSTELTTLDNKRCIMPNGAIFGTKIINYSHHPNRRVDINVGVEYAADINETRATLEGCVKNVKDGLDEPGSDVVLLGLGDSSVNWVVRVWTTQDKYWDVYQQTIQAVKEALDGAQISIPFPQMDVHLDRLDKPVAADPN